MRIPNSHARIRGDSRPRDVKDKTVMGRTANLIMYDFCVCIYLFLFLFFIGWACYGLSIYNTHSSTKTWCHENNTEFFLVLAYSSLFMLIFIIVGFLCFIFSIIMQSCDEGSCSEESCCCYCIWLCTFGGCFNMCDCRPK